MSRRLLVGVLLLLLSGSAWGLCTGSVNFACDTEGEANLKIIEMFGSLASSYDGDCEIVAQEGRFIMAWIVNNSTPCYTPQGGWNASFETTCADAPDADVVTENPSPAQQCIDGCTSEQGGCSGGQIDVCLPDACLSCYSTTGTVCDPGADYEEAPEGCGTTVDGVIICDCLLTPGAPFCPGGEHGGDCTDNGDGTSTCDPGNPPVPPESGDPDAPGGPGSDGDPQHPGPGQSCQAGDPNCYNSGGGVCQAGETCSVSGPSGETSGASTEGSGTANTVGNCDTAPTCSGDAIQCAILVQQWKNSCQWADTKGEAAPWEEGGDSDYGRDLVDDAQEVDVSGGMDDSGYGAGGCPAPISVGVFSTSFDIDFTQICEVAGVARVFVIVITLLWAGPYVVRSIT